MTPNLMIFIAWVILSMAALPLIFYYLHLYKREVRIKTLSSSKTEGIVVGYSRSSEANTPIVEYQVNGKPYRRDLDYTWVTVISSPFKPRWAKASSNLLDKNIIIVRNSIISFTSVLQDAFPKGSHMMVWYNPKKPNESYVERYCDKDKYFKKLVWLMVIIYIICSMMCLILVYFYTKYNVTFES